MHDAVLDNGETRSQTEPDMQHFGFLHMDIRVSAGRNKSDAAIPLLVFHIRCSRKHSKYLVIEDIR